MSQEDVISIFQPRPKDDDEYFVYNIYSHKKPKPHARGSMVTLSELTCADHGAILRVGENYNFFLLADEVDDAPQKLSGAPTNTSLTKKVQTGDLLLILDIKIRYRKANLAYHSTYVKCLTKDLNTVISAVFQSNIEYEILSEGISI